MSCHRELRASPSLAFGPEGDVTRSIFLHPSVLNLLVTVFGRSLVNRAEWFSYPRLQPDLERRVFFFFSLTVDLRSPGPVPSVALSWLSPQDACFCSARGHPTAMTSILVLQGPKVTQVFASPLHQGLGQFRPGTALLVSVLCSSSPPRGAHKRRASLGCPALCGPPRSL